MVRIELPGANLAAVPALLATGGQSIGRLGHEFVISFKVQQRYQAVSHMT